MLSEQLSCLCCRKFVDHQKTLNYRRFHITVSLSHAYEPNK
uniref:Uncharacterized protein n=1 Tax=Arundo donax TaxID=35708 RepID=A0A0A9B9M6_ARUDO